MLRIIKSKSLARDTTRMQTSLFVDSEIILPLYFHFVLKI